MILRFTRNFILIAALSILPFLAAHSQDKQAKVAAIGFYNLENLFDTIDDPITDDVEFTPNGPSKWDSKKYTSKLEHMATVIAQIGDEIVKGGPVIVGVSEIENRQVVVDLTNTPPLKGMGYEVAHFDSPDKRGVDVALIYQTKSFKLLDSKPHPLHIAGMPDFFTRDILEVKGLLDGDPITVLVNHWPSRSRGEKESAPLRNAAADLCRSIADSILKINPSAKIVIMGDLNDDPTDESLTKHLKIVTKPENAKTGDLFDPMWQMFKDGAGSLAYQDSWNLFDQIIVSDGLLKNENSGYRFYRARIFNKKFIFEKEGQYKGYPFRTFAGGVYQNGYSDHCPVYIFLVKGM